MTDAALVDSALRKSGLISNGCSGLIIYLCGLRQIRPYIKWMFQPYHIYMRPTANPALYQMDVPALSHIYAVDGKSGLISNGKE